MSQAKFSYYAKRAVEEEALAMEATNPFERKKYERIAELYWQRAAERNLDLRAPAFSVVHTPLASRQIEVHPYVAESNYSQIPLSLPDDAGYAA